MRFLISEYLILSNLLQMPNDHWMIDEEIVDNFFCSYKMMSYNGFTQWVIINFQSQATMLLIFKNFLSTPGLCVQKQFLDLMYCLWYELPLMVYVSFRIQ